MNIELKCNATYSIDDEWQWTRWNLSTSNGSWMCHWKLRLIYIKNNNSKYVTVSCMYVGSNVHGQRWPGGGGGRSKHTALNRRWFGTIHSTVGSTEQDRKHLCTCSMCVYFFVWQWILNTKHARTVPHNDSECYYVLLSFVNSGKTIKRIQCAYVNVHVVITKSLMHASSVQNDKIHIKIALFTFFVRV